MLLHKKLIKTKISWKVLYLIKILAHFDFSNPQPLSLWTNTIAEFPLLLRTSWLSVHLRSKELWVRMPLLSLKGALSGLIQFLAIESPLKMVKNGFYFTSNGLFVLKIFKGCVRYIFASLFCISKREHFRNNEKCFLFHVKSSSRSWRWSNFNILGIQIWWHHQMPKHETRNTYY